MSISIQTMLEAGVHFGHQTKFWNPKMKPYIFGSRNKIHIINLDKTYTLFDEALKFISQTVKNKGTVLFVGTRTQASEIIAAEAMRAGMPFVDHRWLGGMLTNFETVKKSIKKLEVTRALLEKTEESGLSKKELLDLSRSVGKLQSSIGGISEMKGLPAALFIIDTGCHDIAIKEAKKLGIPVIGIVDTNNDPSEVDFVIPGNDDSAKAIGLYTQAVADTILKARDSVITDLANEVKLEMVEDGSATKHKTIRRVKSADAQDTASPVAQTNTPEVKPETVAAPASEESAAAKPKKKAVAKSDSAEPVGEVAAPAAESVEG